MPMKLQAQRLGLGKKERLAASAIGESVQADGRVSDPICSVLLHVKMQGQAGGCVLLENCNIESWNLVMVGFT